MCSIAMAYYEDTFLHRQHNTYYQPCAAFLFWLLVRNAMGWIYLCGLFELCSLSLTVIPLVALASFPR